MLRFAFAGAWDHCFNAASSVPGKWDELISPKIEHQLPRLLLRTAWQNQVAPPKSSFPSGHEQVQTSKD
jgi:hypothetical protein